MIVLIIDPEINKVYHAACKDEYRHKVYQSQLTCRDFFQNQKYNGYESV